MGMPDFAELLRELRRQAPDATRVRPARPDVSRMPIPTVGPTSAQMPRTRQATIADRAVGLLRGAGEPMGDTPMGMVNEVLNPVRQGVQAREMVGATMAQARRTGRTMGLGDAAVTAALGAMTMASVVPGMPADDAMRAGRQVMSDVPRWTPTPRGIFERGGLRDMQGTVASDARLVLPQGERQTSSMLTDAITTSPIVRAGLRADVERGLPMGGESWYDMAPLRNYMESRATPESMSFEDWTRIGSGSSMNNSVPSEISAATIINYARKRGIPLDEAKRLFLQETGTDKLPMIFGMHREVGERAVRNGVMLPENPLGANWKVPMYTDKRLGGGGDVSRDAAGALPALDTHEKRRLMQFARQDPEVAQLMREQGVFDADHVPVTNASDYKELGGMYVDLANEMGLPTAGTAQAGRWIGGWKETGLKSPPFGDYTQILEDAITYSAQKRGMRDDPESLKRYFDSILKSDDFIVPFTGRGAYPIAPQGK